MKRRLALLAAAALTVAACSGAADDAPDSTVAAPTTTTTTAEEPMMEEEPVTFRVTIENIAPVTLYTDSGAFAVPVGSEDPGPLLPGAAYEFEVNANLGQRLSFATMFVQSNDWIFATGADGLALYSEDGTPISGDVTSQIGLYDAGTEIDQTPGEGADQAPRQAGPDTGADDPDTAVRAVDTDRPAVDELIAVTVTPGTDGVFSVRIDNISDSSSFATPLAPGAFVIHAEGEPLFTIGEADRGEGLAALAEDGDPSGLADHLSTGVGLGVPLPLAPGVYAVLTGMGEEMMEETDDAMTEETDDEMMDEMAGGARLIFAHGEADRGEGLEALAEDGDPSGLVESLTGHASVGAVGAFAVPVGESDPGPLLPGGTYEFTFEAHAGDYLSFATMFVQSNDWFFAPRADGIELFPGSDAISGDITELILIHNAGTEVDEPIGFGPNQAPRQAGPNTGEDENGVLSAVDLTASDFVKVTITPES